MLGGVIATLETADPARPTGQGQGSRLADRCQPERAAQRKLWHDQRADSAL